MHSKGAKKSLEVGTEPQKHQRKYEHSSPGAHNPNYFVMALNKKGNWLKSKIIECRPLEHNQTNFYNQPQKKNLKKN